LTYVAAQEADVVIDTAVRYKVFAHCWWTLAEALATPLQAVGGYAPGVLMQLGLTDLLERQLWEHFDAGSHSEQKAVQ
jgi:hypothetical protein